VATRIWHFEDGSIEDFKGPYEEYMNATAAARR
jgi:ATPase subunit of ABC transporter with duplicated ATPase domains